MTVSDSSSQGAGSGLITGQLSVATQYTTDNVPAIAMNWNSPIDKVNIEYFSDLVYVLSIYKTIARQRGDQR